MLSYPLQLPSYNPESLVTRVFKEDRALWERFVWTCDQARRHLPTCRTTIVSHAALEEYARETWLNRIDIALYSASVNAPLMDAWEAEHYTAGRVFLKQFRAEMEMKEEAWAHQQD